MMVPHTADSNIAQYMQFARFGCPRSEVVLFTSRHFRQPVNRRGMGRFGVGDNPDHLLQRNAAVIEQYQLLPKPRIAVGREEVTAEFKVVPSSSHDALAPLRESRLLEIHLL